MIGRKRRERRAFKRMEVTDRFVQCRWSGSEYQARLIDISEGGLKIDIEEPLQMNQEIELLMEDDWGKPVNRKAVVVWFVWEGSRGLTRAGLKFVLSSEDWLVKGRKLSETGNFQEAIQALTNAIGLNPQNDAAYLNRGLAHHKAGNQEAAVEDLKLAARQGHHRAQELLSKKGIEW
jgi:tetratricopeptide (TPR) repeat protein